MFGYILIKRKKNGFDQCQKYMFTMNETAHVQKKKRMNSNCRTSQKINRVSQQNKDLENIIEILEAYEQKQSKETITLLDLCLNLCCETDTVLNSLNTAISKSELVVPQVSKQTEESFMKEAASEDEKCIMKNNCECMYLDASEKFVGMQLVLPELDVNTEGLCVLCLRKRTQLLFYSILHQGRQTSAVIQKYGNYCGIENEYHPHAMLLMPPTGPVHVMPLPIVAHQRNRYRIVKKDGIRYIEQVGVSMMDFGNASAPTQKLPTSQ